jgi:hypothetical protein
MLLSLAFTANAGLVIQVSKDVGSPFPIWGEYPDSKLTIYPSDYLWIAVSDVTGDVAPGAYVLGMESGFGPGSLSADGIVTYAGITAEVTDNQVLADELGIENMFITMTVTDAQTTLLLSQVLFHCEGEGDVPLVIYDVDGNVADTQVIHQIPEPATLALLSLGGLLVSRKRKV